MNSTSSNFEESNMKSSDLDKTSEMWYKNQLYSGPPETSSSTTLDQIVITTASLVLNDYHNNDSQSPHFRPNSNIDNQLSDYENNPTSPPQGILSKSSSTSSTSSFNIRYFNRSALSLSSTSLSNVSFPMFQPIEYAPNTHYSFYTSDCEDHSDYVPSNFIRSVHGHHTTPSPLISRPSSPLPPTYSPNFSRSPSPNRSLHKLKSCFMPNSSNSDSVHPCSPKYTRSLNGSRETSPLRLRPSSYTRPLSPNPPTVSPGLASNTQQPNQSQSIRNLRSQPSSPQSQPRSPFFHQAINPNQSTHIRSPLGSRSNVSLRSPPSPTRPGPPSGSLSPHRLSYLSRSPVTSRPPSPLNSRQHAILLPSALRPARSQSQPPGSHRLHTRTRSTRTPSPRPPRLPSSANSPQNYHPPPPPPPTSPLPNPGKRHSRMRAR